MSCPEPVLPQIEAFHAELVRIRRDLHAHPELGFEEHRTARRVADALQAWGADEVHTGIGRTGVVGVIRGSRPRRVEPGAEAVRAVALRADMDALPIAETGAVPWRSTQPGLMHACGHDGHTTMLLGAARHLAVTRRFEGVVYCVFQPAEEGRGGARAMLDDGLFERFPADRIYGMHNWPGLPLGHIGLAPGAMMAAADRITVTVRGSGGHGAHPDEAVDTVLAAAHVIAALQTIVARSVEPGAAAVVSICAMHGGDLGAMSVIPRQVTLVGTVRTFRESVQALVEARLRRIVHSVAQAFGASGELRYERVYPATANTPQAAFDAAEAATELVGDAAVVRDLPPSMGAEDFSLMLQRVPGAYLRLGVGGTHSLHTPDYDFNDAALPLGAALYARLAERLLATPALPMP